MAGQIYPQVLDILSATLAGLVAARFLQLGLYRRFPYFFVYCVFCALRSFSLLPLARASNTYFWIWIWTQPLTWVFYVQIVREIYMAATADYPGIQRLGQKVMWGGLAVAAILSAVTLVPKLQGLATMSATLGIYTYTERGVCTAVLLFLFLMVAFLWHYPIRLNRTLLYHLLIFTVFFFANNILTLLRAYFGYRASRPLNDALDLVLILSRAGWLALPVAQEIKHNVRLRFQLEEPDERRLLGQLGLLNANLVASGKRWS